MSTSKEGSGLKFISSQNMYLTNRYKKYGIDIKVDQRSFMPVMFTGCDLSFVNALRRIFVSEIDNLAIADKIDIKSNTSQYHREVLLDRFGFITLNMEYVEKEKLDESEMVFSLSNPEAPDLPLRNTSGTILKVFLHQHLKFYYKNQERNIQDICPYNSILLTLNPKEEIHATMSPTIGCGRQHPRWNTCIAMYKFGTELDDDPQNQIIESNQQQMDYKGKVNRKPTSIMVTIEAIGKMSSFSVLEKGLHSLKRKLILVNGEIDQIPTSTKVSAEVDELMPNFIKYRFDDEDHTLGHVLEFACLHELMQLIGDDETLLTECLCGYRKPHPLDNYMELIIRTPSVLEVKPDHMVHKAMESLIDLCDKMLEEIKKM